MSALTTYVLLWNAKVILITEVGYKFYYVEISKNCIWTIFIWIKLAKSVIILFPKGMFFKTCRLVKYLIPCQCSWSWKTKLIIYFPTIVQYAVHWIQESIKRKFNSGLFWAVWAAEKKKSNCHKYAIVEVSFLMFSWPPKNYFLTSKIWKKHPKKLHAYGSWEVFSLQPRLPKTAKNFISVL